MSQKTQKQKNAIIFTLPFASAAIIFLGVVRIYLYYSEFNINILQYISLSEVIGLFLDIIKTPLYAIFIVYFLILIAFTIDEFHSQIIKSKILKNKRSSDNTQTTEFKEEIPMRKELKIIAIGLPFIALILPLAAKLITEKHNYAIVISIIALAGAIIFSMFFLYWWIFLKRRNYLAISFAICTIMLFIIHTNFKEVSDVKFNNKYFGTIVYLKDSSRLISDSSNYFIGKTADFVFFHDVKSEATLAVSMSEVKSILIKSRKIPFLNIKGGIRPNNQPLNP